MAFLGGDPCYGAPSDEISYAFAARGIADESPDNPGGSEGDPHIVGKRFSASLFTAFNVT